MRLPVPLWQIFPMRQVVPMGKARIRTQMSAAHTAEDIDFAIEAFAKSR